MALFAAPAHAQGTPAAEEEDAGTIVITGSILRRTSTETPSPVTVLSAESLQQRGINTVAEAVQRLSANGMGNITKGWNNGNNFATGANAVSLRGLTVQSTLTLFDGMRMSTYPLADDGHRNFVDLNTIPNAIIERIEVLRDGASSTYGADAVAGVVNVITKKQVTGIHLNGSAGLSGRNDAGEQRFDATVGYGDLEDQGFNFYINGEYQRQELLWARDRDYPFNTSDFSSSCVTNSAGVKTCRPNGNQNGINADGTFNGLFATPYAVVRSVSPTGAATSNFALLNPSLGCGDLTPVVAPSGSAAGNTVCSRDTRKLYSTLQPQEERLGGAFRLTVRLGDAAEFYAAANYYQVRTHTQATPGNFAGTTPPPTAFALASTFLPAYVCPTGVGSTTMLATGCTAANGQLNPYNPFAASGSRAQLLIGYDRPRELDTKARSLRGAMGVNGTIADDWNYAVDLTVSEVSLDVINKNVLIPGRVMDVIAKGTYNFADQSQNSEAIRDFIAPVSLNHSVSNLWQTQATLSKGLFELPGGTFQAAVGLSYRHESINNPSANPANLTDPASRYYVINAVGAVGARDVKSAFFELDAPIVKQFSVEASGRFDDYSSGQSNFSPKIGAKFTPIPQLMFRGTFSKGFRIPSFNEAYGLPTTGYVTRQLNTTAPYYAAFVASHGSNTYSTGQFSLGQTSIGNASLAPEKSTSWTLGVLVEPIKNVSVTLDYYNIKIKDLIANATYNIDDVLTQYYSNNGVVNIPGITVIPGTPDVNFPNALPHIGFIQASFENTDSERVSGLDFGVNARVPVTDDITWTTNFDASYLIKMQRVYPDRVENYEGTLSPCDVTSCSGAPRWRGSWQNTFQYKDTTAALTVYYTDGYDLASIDYGGVKGDCAASIGASVVPYRDNVTPVLCKAKATWNTDLTVTQKIAEKFTVYVNVLNVLNTKPPFDPSAAYSIFQFNPSWAGPNIMGRYFRLGAKLDF